jgi:hypothetical protein
MSQPCVGTSLKDKLILQKTNMQIAFFLERAPRMKSLGPSCTLNRNRCTQNGVMGCTAICLKGKKVSRLKSTCMAQLVDVYTCFSVCDFMCDLMRDLKMNVILCAISCTILCTL